MSPSQQPGDPPPASLPQDLGQSVVLAERASQGDVQALNELLARYRARVYRLAHVRMRSQLRKVMDSEEIAQRTLIIAARKITGFEVRSHAAIINWLSRIVQNQLRDAADQARTRRDCVPIDPRMDQTGPVLEHAHPGPSASDEASLAELQELYDACVAELPDDMREALLLRESASATWGEIATELGRPGPAAARELYRRGAAKVREMLRARLKERLD